MTTRELTLQLPDELYKQLVSKAATTHQPLDAIVLQSLRAGMPPNLEHVPLRFLADLEALDAMEDALLWQIANTEMSEDKIDQYDVLLQKNQQESLTPSERRALDTLREEADLLMLRRSYAYALLKWRGHRIPSLDKNGL